MTAVRGLNRLACVTEAMRFALEAVTCAAPLLQDDEAAKVVDLGRRFCRIVRSRCGVAPAKPGIRALTALCIALIAVSENDEVGRAVEAVET